MPLFLFSLLIWFVSSYQKRKNQHEIAIRDNLLKQQQLIIEKQQAIENERNRIASEMHDDLGSGLTSIKFLTQQMNRWVSGDEPKTVLSKIENQSQKLVANLSEIIWTMNTRYDDVANLAGYMKRYTHQFLNDYEIDVKFTVDDCCKEQNISGENRRDLFLILKEILHNAVKYSQMNQFHVHMSCHPNLNITIDEIGGIGFDPITSEIEGNGLYNIRKRLEKIGGQITFEKRPEAMHYQIDYSFKLLPS